MTKDAPIILVGLKGESLGRLRVGAFTIVSEAESRAARESLAKATAISAELKSQIERAGFQVTPDNLQTALNLVNQFRRGEAVPSISVTVRNVGGALEGDKPSRLPEPTPTELKLAPNVKNNPNTMTSISFFEAERTYPNEGAQTWYESLKGLDDHKEKLLLELEILLYPNRLEEWSKRHHNGKILTLCERSRNRVPLIIFEGDVGTGKTALAETVGDALVRRTQSRNVHLLKLNTQVRGTGHVGEMSDLIVQAFIQAEARARSLKGDPVLLLLDEADALTASREIQQMHHEDKAGLNTIIQRLDNLRSTRLPIATLFITNRPDALDPAIRRRAALTLRFDRPNDKIRAEIFRASVPELNLTDATITRLVLLTGKTNEKNEGASFTASDLTDRLLPGAFRAAYAQNRAMTATDILNQAESLSATPPFGSKIS